MATLQPGGRWQAARRPGNSNEERSSRFPSSTVHSSGQGRQISSCLVAGLSECASLESESNTNTKPSRTPTPTPTATSTSTLETERTLVKWTLETTKGLWRRGPWRRMSCLWSRVDTQSRHPANHTTQNHTTPRHNTPQHATSHQTNPHRTAPHQTHSHGRPACLTIVVVHHDTHA